MKEISNMINKFEKLLINAQTTTYDANFRNLVLNKPPIADAMSFREVAEIVMNNLSDIDPAGTDPDITKVVHSIQDILNTFKTPDPNEMLNAANGALSQTQSKAPNDLQKPQKLTAARYLVNLTKILIMKFFQKHPEKKDDKEDAKKVAPVPQSTASFILKVYRDLRNNKPLSQVDLQTWQANKNIYHNRLNFLTKKQDKTQQQNEEQNIIQFVVNKLG